MWIFSVLTLEIVRHCRHCSIVKRRTCLFYGVNFSEVYIIISKMNYILTHQCTAYRRFDRMFGSTCSEKLSLNFSLMFTFPNMTCGILKFSLICIGLCRDIRTCHYRYPVYVVTTYDPSVLLWSIWQYAWKFDKKRQSMSRLRIVGMRVILDLTTIFLSSSCHVGILTLCEFIHICRNEMHL